MPYEIPESMQHLVHDTIARDNNSAIENAQRIYTMNKPHHIYQAQVVEDLSDKNHPVWCCQYGAVKGLGATPALACEDFDDKWLGKNYHKPS